MEVTRPLGTIGIVEWAQERHDVDAYSVTVASGRLVVGGFDETRAGTARYSAAQRPHSSDWVVSGTYIAATIVAIQITDVLGLSPSYSWRTTD